MESSSVLFRCMWWWLMVRWLAGSSAVGDGFFGVLGRRKDAIDPWAGDSRGLDMDGNRESVR